MKFSDSFKTIRKIAEHTGPFLGANGPVIALVGIFLPQAPSRELRLMKKEFARVDANFDSVFAKFSEVKILIEDKSLKTQYAALEQTILSLSTRLQEYLTSKIADLAVYNGSFVREYESSYGVRRPRFGLAWLRINFYFLAIFL